MKRVLAAADQQFAHANHLLDVLVKQDEAIPSNATRLERWGEICYTLKKIGDETIAFFHREVADVDDVGSEETTAYTDALERHITTVTDVAGALLCV